MLSVTVGDYMKQLTIAQLVEELKAVLHEERVSQNPTILEHHSKDESYHTPRLRDVVVFPKTTHEVSEVLKIAQKFKIPVVPFGIGSSLEGHVIPYEGGITIDFSLMNKIIEIREKDMLVKVQPGVTRTQLNKHLKQYGLFFPIDPGADATLGGMAATGASETTTVKYGTMREQVQDLEVVLADGTIIHTGSLAAKSSSGLHLNGLFVGSEGTLGCFTELTLKVYGIPEYVMAARAVFENINDAVDAVFHIRQAGIPIARVELVDEESIKVINAYSQTDYPVKSTLLFEFHGNKHGLRADMELVKEIVSDFRCVNFQFEADRAKQNQLWKVRHNLAYAFIQTYNGRKFMSTDVCVPISELAGAISHAQEALLKSGLAGGIAGHVGDGNFHICIMIDEKNPADIEKANQLNEAVVRDALSRGGTCTGEHGVGVGKKKYQEKEHGEALQIMKKIKGVLDPHGILNPGKMF